MVADSAKNSLLEALEKSLGIYNERFDRLVELPNEPNAHDFRVCVRRFLAGIKVNEKFFSLANFDAAKRELRKEFKELAFLRETQVFIELSRKYYYRFPAMYSFAHYLLEVEKSLAEKARESFAAFDKEKVLRNVEKNLAAIKDSEEYPSREKARRYAAKKFEKVKARASNLNVKKSDFAAAHKLRLAFKKFRYTAEIFAEDFGLGKDFFARAKAFQTVLGDLNDLNNFIESFDKYAEENNISDFEEIREISESLREELNERLKNLGTEIDALDFFDVFGKEK